jgi:hypothetical protein
MVLRIKAEKSSIVNNQKRKKRVKFALILLLFLKFSQFLVQYLPRERLYKRKCPDFSCSRLR